MYASLDERIPFPTRISRSRRASCLSSRCSPAGRVDVHNDRAAPDGTRFDRALSGTRINSPVNGRAARIGEVGTQQTPPPSLRVPQVASKSR